MLAAILSLAGTRLTTDEAALFRDADPAGYILFARNIADREQVRALTDALRALHGRDDLAILTDQEGGRVARMRPPVWPAFPANAAFDRLYQRAPASAMQAARWNARAIGLTLVEVGITVDCLPMLDVRQPGASDIVGDRALGADPMQVSALGRAQLEGLASAGVVGVVKHIPGHGRALVDSHKALPFVDASDADLAIDLEPFERLADAPMGMTSHIVYRAWDAELPASQSPTIIRDIIRGRIGFDGFLMSDDIGMEALYGDIAARAAACVAAGCDVALHCSGVLAESVRIVGALPGLSDEGEARLTRAMASRLPDGDGMTLAEAIDTRDQLLALA
ncbi:MAG: beta-N-acetylhexosaminidase [Sphingomicrobium sp.]